MQCSTSSFLHFPTISYPSLHTITPIHTLKTTLYHQNLSTKIHKHGICSLNNASNVLYTEEEEEEYSSFEISIIPKLITSSSNPFVKHCVKLRQSSSYRHSHGLILLIGSTLIRDIHEFHVYKRDYLMEIECLILLENAEVPEGLGEIPVDRVYVSSLVMKKLAGVQSTESIEAISLMRSPKSCLDLKDEQMKVDCKEWFGCASTHRILVLEGIQDPGNLGTLLRSALAFKWVRNSLFPSPEWCFHASSMLRPVQREGNQGKPWCPFQLPVVSGNWTLLETFRKEVQAKVMAGHPDSSNDVKPVLKLSQELANSLAGMPLCLVLGREGSGLSKKARQLCELVSIPMAGNFESLNVAVADGIFMFMLQSKES